MDMKDIKSEPYESLNPNGRLPAIVDPNTDITLFESGAILEYLVETYDKDAKLHYTTSPEKFLTKSWLHLQMSGQGPYFGQRAWFGHLHPDKIPSAIERYGNEIKRVLGVIERHLKKTGTDYLVGDKITYADLAFVPWNVAVPWLMGDELDTEKEFPTFHAWHKRVTERPAVKKVLDEKNKAMAASRG